MSINVSFTTNAGSLAARQRRRAASFMPLQQGAMRQATDDLLSEARKLSSKQYANLKELRRRGHPYARGGTAATPERFGRRLRAGFPKGPMPAPPFMVNLQSGRFFGAWRRLVRRGTGQVTGTVYNTAPCAKYMRGTRFMIARPILGEAMRRTHKHMTRRFAGAMHKANATR